MQQEIEKIEKFIWNSFETENRIGLFDGLSGLALFYYYLNEAHKKDEHQNKLIAIVEKIDDLLENNYQLTYCTGLAGYGVMLLKVKSENLEIDESYFENIDDLLQEQLQDFSYENNYDFFHGAMGISMYFIERYKHNASNENVNRILIEFTVTFIDKINANLNKVLEATSEERGAFYSFGLAHGVASYINHLIYLKNHFLEIDFKIDLSLKTCIDFLFEYKKTVDKSRFFYPNVYCIAEQKCIDSRLAWCQGDLGIANALFNASQYLNDVNYYNHAKELMENALKINRQESGINDFGLCHGSSGLIIQYFLTQNKNTGINFDSHIKDWFDFIKIQTNDYENFLSYNVIENKNNNENNVLEGAAGLGLTILTLNYQIDTKWLELFHLH